MVVVVVLMVCRTDAEIRAHSAIIASFSSLTIMAIIITRHSRADTKEKPTEKAILCIQELVGTQNDDHITNRATFAPFRVGHTKRQDKQSIYVSETLITVTQTQLRISRRDQRRGYSQADR